MHFYIQRNLGYSVSYYVQRSLTRARTSQSLFIATGVSESVFNKRLLIDAVFFLDSMMTSFLSLISVLCGLTAGYPTTPACRTRDGRAVDWGEQEVPTQWTFTPKLKLYT